MQLQSLDIGEAAYCSDWPGSSKSFQIGIQLMIYRAQRTMPIKAMHLITLNLQTFSSVRNYLYLYIKSVTKILTTT